MDKPIYSILMPVYNGARFLQEAMDSILAQSYAAFELIVIDDCSSDNSYSLLQAYTDPRIRLLRNNKNYGISATLNRGIALATSEWIVRMDCDDICYPNRLQKQDEFIRQHPDGALYSCGVRVVDEAGMPVRIDRVDSRHYYYNLYFFCLIYHPSVVLRKSAVQHVGGYTVAYAEDFELFWQLSRHHKIYHQEDVLMDYRQTSQSLHQVTHKKEYDQAQLDQMLRNMRSVTGPDLQVPRSHLYCLQHNFAPLEKEGSVRSITNCFKTLDLVSAAIAQHPNPNNHPPQVAEAASFKKRFILEHFMRTLPTLKAVMLLAGLGEWAYLLNRAASRLFSKRKA